MTESFEVLRAEAIERRRRELADVSENPATHGWPEKFLEDGRSKRGETGVRLVTLGNALGCPWQTVKSLAGKPLATVVSHGKPVEVWDPDHLTRLRDHPKVLAQRERKVLRPDDKDRLREVVSCVNAVSMWQLVHVGIEDFRSIRAADFDIDDLTVLLGRNGVGKSSLLDAMMLAIGRTDIAASDRGDVTFFIQGSLVDGPNQAASAAAYCSIGLPDPLAEALFSILRVVLTRPTLVGRPGQWVLGFPPTDRPDHLEIERLLMSSETSSRLVGELLEVASLAANTPVGVPSLRAEGPGLTVSVLGADVSTLEERLHENLPGLAESYLWRLKWHDDVENAKDAAQTNVEDLADSGAAPAKVPPSARIRWCSASGLPSHPGRATHADLELTSRTGTERRRVDLSVTTDLVGAFEDLVAFGDAAGEAAGYHEAFTVLGGLLRIFGPGGSDTPWFSADDPTVICAMASLLVVEALANELAPDFIAEEGRIVLLPPKHLEARLVAVGLLSVDAGFTQLENLPSGLGRWVALLVEYSLANAGDRWAAASRQWDEPVFAPDGAMGQLAAAQALADSVLATPVGFSSLRLLLADEPELHLHPSAQEEIVRWLLQLSREISVVVATHAPAFLRLSPAEARLVRVSRESSAGTESTTLDGAFLQNIDALADELGLGRERILQLVRGFVVVEGVADQVVLSRFAQEVLDRYRLCVVPIGGHSRASGFVDGDLALAIGLPIAAVFDNITIADIQRFVDGERKGLSDEVKSAGRILALRERGLNCEVIPFDVPDVIEAIPETTVRRRFSKFESWTEMRSEWELSDVASYKNFVLDSWQVSRREDFATIEALVNDSNSDDALPASFRQMVKALEAWAEGLGVRVYEVPTD